MNETIKIKFDRSCAGWTGHSGCNIAFLQVQKEYLIGKLLNRGYLYLNEVYETLGAKWEPTRENICWHGRPIWIDIVPVNEYDYVVKVS